MRVCHHYQISHSEFLAWSDLDRAKALAFMIREGQRCPRDGTHPDEWTDPDNPRIPVVTWRATHKQCEGCTAIREYRQQHLTKEEQEREDIHVLLEHVTWEEFVADLSMPLSRAASPRVDPEGETVTPDAPAGPGMSEPPP